jgi:hypothetical protein
MPSSPQIPPILTLHRTSPGSYALRLFDLADNFLAANIAKFIPDLQTLLVITPSDMKVFSFSENGNQQQVEEEIREPVTESSDPMQDAIDLAEQAERAEQPKLKVVAETPQGKVVRRRKSVTPEAGMTDTCGRCGGAGVVGVLMEGGQAAQGTCPLCQGAKVIRRFGHRRGR